MSKFQLTLAGLRVGEHATDAVDFLEEKMPGLELNSKPPEFKEQPNAEAVRCPEPSLTKSAHHAALIKLAEAVSSSTSRERPQKPATKSSANLAMAAAQHTVHVARALQQSKPTSKSDANCSSQQSVASGLKPAPVPSVRKSKVRTRVTPAPSARRSKVRTHVALPRSTFAERPAPAGQRPLRRPETAGQRLHQQRVAEQMKLAVAASQRKREARLEAIARNRKAQLARESSARSDRMKFAVRHQQQQRELRRQKERVSVQQREGLLGARKQVIRY
jgi:hypothetical protein